MGFDFFDDFIFTKWLGLWVFDSARIGKSVPVQFSFVAAVRIIQIIDAGVFHRDTIRLSRNMAMQPDPAHFAAIIDAGVAAYHEHAVPGFVPVIRWVAHFLQKIVGRGRDGTMLTHMVEHLLYAVVIIRVVECSIFESLIHLLNQPFRERSQRVCGTQVESSEYRNASIRHDFVVPQTVPAAFFLWYANRARRYMSLYSRSWPGP